MKENDLVIERVFSAPPEAVWRAWTEPEQARLWWGPKGFTTPVCRIDLRVGGTYLNCMRSSEGQDYWSTGTYREVVPPQKLVCTDCFADETGAVVSASHYGMSGEWPLELLITATFVAEGETTRLTLRHAGLPAGEEREQCAVGWNEMFDKLADYLAA